MNTHTQIKQNRGYPVALSASTFLCLAKPTARASLRIQNDSVHDVELYRDSDPFGIEFDGGDHVACNGVSTNAALIASTKGFIKARVRFDAISGAEQTIFSVSDVSANEYMRLYIDVAGKLKAELRTAAAVQWSIILTTALEALKWYTVKLKHDATTPTLYVDGQLSAQTVTATTDASVWFSGLSNLDAARVGSLNTNTAGEADWFDGKIAGLKVMDNIGTDYNEAAIVYYPIDEGTGTTLTDRSGNSLDGTFGATTAAPSWTATLGPLILGPGADYPETIAVSQTGIWIYTAGATGNVYFNEGLTAPKEVF